MTVCRRAAVAASIWLASIGPAVADAIDGDWCGPEGGRISIRGDQVTTRGGTAMTGTYSRHYFSYAVPDGEQGAGGTLHMELIDDQTVRLRVQTRSGAPDNGPRQVWTRCRPVS